MWLICLSKTVNMFRFKLWFGKESVRMRDNLNCDTYYVHQIIIHFVYSLIHTALTFFGTEITRWSI